MREYSSLSELVREVLEYKVIDLVPFAIGIDPGLLETLEEPNTGLYLPGSIEPVFVQKPSTPIYRPGSVEPMVQDPAAQEEYLLVTNKGEHVVTFGDILRDAMNSGPSELPPGDFYTKKQKLHLRRAGYTRIRRELKMNPNVPVRGCEAAISVALSYLDGLCKYTHVSSQIYNLGRVVKAEFHHLLEKDTYEEAFNELIQEVKQFVGRDVCNIYHYKVVGTTLVIEKCLDFRVYEWHANRIKMKEGYDHDAGGVLHGYEF